MRCQAGDTVGQWRLENHLERDAAWSAACRTGARGIGQSEVPSSSALVSPSAGCGSESQSEWSSGPNPTPSPNPTSTPSPAEGLIH
jgi:hypothetical protein